LAAAACGSRDATSPAGLHPEYEYAIVPPGAASWSLAVEAHLHEAPSERLVAPEAEGTVGDVLADRGGRWELVRRENDAWLAPECRRSCTLRYTVDLGKLGAGCRGMHCARRVGDAVIGTAGLWMLRPDPSGDEVIHVTVRGGDESRMATGLRRDGRGGFLLRARELGEASFTAFGGFRRQRARVAGATLDVALLGPPLSMGDEAAAAWVSGAADCVASLYGRFPVDATVFVVPVRGADQLVFGRVLSLAGASVVLLFGDEARPTSAHEDWIAVHELFHLGTPSFVGEGHWLEEGLATYYEPILRARAQWTSEGELWRHFMREMPRGLRKPGAPPALEDRDDIDSTYWGGALFALLADVRIREQTHGARSLDDVLRASLARLGDATHSATVAEFLALGDESSATHVLTDLYARDAVAGEPVDLDALWRSLGIEPRPDGGVALRDDAPLAGIRAALVARENR
jgi:predicted metalloprotease with PDZ domain